MSRDDGRGAGTAASTIGIAIPESVWSARSERFYTQVLHGLEDTVVPRGHAVLSRVTRSVQEEIEALRVWAAEGLVDVVILKDLREDDPRPAIVRRLGLASVAIGDEQQHFDGSSVTTDNSGTMRRVLQELHERGHERIGHVGGPSDLLHSRLRRETYEEFVRERRLPMLTAQGDYSAASGDRCTQDLLDDAVRPSVILYDNDAMAIAGCDCATAAGLVVPQDLSIVAWDDSPACQTHEPPIAVIDRQPHQLGVELGKVASALFEEPDRVVRIAQEAARLESRGTVVPRP